MSGEIKLHPTKGLNPRMTVCQSCGKDSGIVLLGRYERKHTCKRCDLVHYGPVPETGCPQCQNPKGGNEWKDEMIGDHEKLPGGLCDECTALRKETQAMVADGGIFFRCLKCGSEGALKADHPLAKKVREKLKLEAPNPCGVELTNCQQCTKPETETTP